MVGIPWLNRLGAVGAQAGVLVAWLVLLPNGARGQDTTALPAALLRRVAEVADGQRLGTSVYVVARRAFPHHVAGVFTTRADANAVRARFPSFPDLVVVGPVGPTIDLGPLGGHLAGGCVHNRWTTAMRDKPRDRDMPSPLAVFDSVAASGVPALINDSMLMAMPPLGICGMGIVPYASVASVTITTRMRDGTSTSVIYPARDIDAVFFSLDALDKFAFPYYDKLFGAAAAASMRVGVVQRILGR